MCLGKLKEELLHYVEETSLAEDVELENLSVTPCIIVCGPSCYAADRFMLSVDRKIVNDDITTFIAAVSLMFGSYYCFNIHYPTELASVLELLQRMFIHCMAKRLWTPDINLVYQGYFVEELCPRPPHPTSVPDHTNSLIAECTDPKMQLTFVTVVRKTFQELFWRHE